MNDKKIYSAVELADMYYTQRLTLTEISEFCVYSYSHIFKLIKTIPAPDDYQSLPSYKTRTKNKISDELEKQIIQKYAEIQRATLVSDYFNIPVWDIKKILKHNGIALTGLCGPRKNNCTGKEESIIEDYLNYFSLETLQEKYHTSYTTLCSVLKNNDITIRGEFSYYINESYFQNINEPNKGYFFGLMMADGNIYKRTRGNHEEFSSSISLQERDGYLLEKFKLETENQRQLSLVHKGPGRQDQVLFSTYSKIFVNNLENLDFTERKSFSCCIPLDKIPKELLRFVILGIFDGDGWSTCGSYLRGSQSKKEHKLDQVFEASRGYIGICGSEATILQIKEVFDSLGIYSGILYKQCQGGKLFYLSISKIQNILKIYDYFYQNSSFFLLRKKHKFEELFRLKGLNIVPYPDHNFPLYHNARNPQNESFRGSEGFRKMLFSLNKDSNPLFQGY